MNDVKIRFNTNYPTSRFKWRFLLNGKENLVDDIEINCKSWTSTDIVKGDDGNDIEKFHISCNPERVTFQIITDTHLKVILE
jgi:hypothetical protein